MNTTHTRVVAILTTLIFLSLSALYCIYVDRQIADVFFEAQFLHYEFLKELLDGHLTARGFFTVFGEHMFPGYNIILALNVIFFRIWGGFDSVVYGFFLILGAGIVVYRTYIDVSWSPMIRILGSALISLLLLSAIHNPMWGMALSAAGGVCIFIICVHILITALWGTRSLFCFYLLSPIALILFLGGYGIGAIGAFSLVLLIRAIEIKKINKSSLWIGVSIVATVAAYIAITSHYSDMAANTPTGGAHDISLMAKFAVVMTGASLLGKSFYEQGSGMLIYYITGFILLLATIIAWIYILRRPRINAMFIFALSAYSITTVLAVSIFRYRNGLEGAMGQWYAIHTHFIPIAIVWWLCELISIRNRWKQVVLLPLLGLFVLSVVGYYADWKKSIAVPEYKAKFIAEAPIILAFPNTIENKKDMMQTMLWYYPQVKETIDLMYQHHLWIFKSTAIAIRGLTFDNWIEAERPVSIMCPSGTRSISFKLWRKEKWVPSEVAIRVADRVRYYAANSDISISFDKNQPALLMIDARGLEESNPVTTPPDLRKLVAIMSEAKCH